MAIRIEAFNPLSTLKVPAFSLSIWIPGSVMDPDKAAGNSLSALTGLANFEDNALIATQPTDQLREIYRNDNPKDISPPINVAIVDASKEFRFCKEDSYNIITSNPK